MNLSILQRAGTPNFSPYPHIVIENCLPDELYDELEATRPSDQELVHARPLGSNMRLDRHARHLLADASIPDIWRQFIKYHVSYAFWQEVVKLFDAELGPGSAVSGWVLNLTGRPLATMPTVVRTHPASRNSISLDVNVGVNTPVVGAASSVRGPHVDNPIEVFAAMLYMPPKDAPDEGGDFVIYEKSRTVRFEGKAEVSANDVRSLVEHARVKYKRNTMVAFINSVHAIHGVTPRLSRDFRRLVNFIVELPFTQFELPR